MDRVNTKSMFGCGIDGRLFKEKFDNLPEEGRRRIEKVARRLWLTLMLRYRLAVLHNPFLGVRYSFDLQDVELPSMEVYLLVTCLDTLAGKSTYVDFRDWIKTHSCAPALEVDEISTLYAQYLDEYGVTRNLRQIFTEIPKCVKDWLSQNVAIYQFDKMFDKDRSGTVDELVTNLFKYFYNVRRNEYTHSSSSRQTLTARDVIDPKKVDNNGWVTPASGSCFILDKRKPDQEWGFSYRQGLDEATILRVIIHAVVLQLLCIELTDEILVANLNNYSRLSALHNFVQEVDNNASFVRAWGLLNVKESSEFHEYLIYDGVPLLGIDASKTMVGRFISEYPLEAGLQQMTAQYIDEVFHINSEISKFNEAFPPSKGGNERRWQIISDFFLSQSQTQPYIAVLNWPSRIEMTNVWGVISDPCYS